MDWKTNILRTIKQEMPVELEDKNRDIFDYQMKIKIENPDVCNDWSIENNLQIENVKTEYPEEVHCDDLKMNHHQKCLFCHKLFPNRYQLIQHHTTHLTILLVPLALYQCDHCKLYYMEKSKLRTHISSKHTSACLRKQLPVTKRTHQCKVCNKIFTYKSWHSHMLSVHSQNVKCTICNFTFKSQTYLMRHNLYKHSNIEYGYKRRCYEQKCGICSKVFKSIDCLQYHMKNFHSNNVKNSEPIQCSMCKSILKCKTYLATHLRRVHYNDGKIHKCDICFKQFKSPRYLRIHIKNTHNKKNCSNLRCEHCGQHCRTDQTFANHTQRCVKKDKKLGNFNNNTQPLDNSMQTRSKKKVQLATPLVKNSDTMETLNRLQMNLKSEDTTNHTTRSNNNVTFINRTESLKQDVKWTSPTAECLSFTVTAQEVPNSIPDQLNLENVVFYF